MLVASIPTTGSPRAIFCLVGIVYFVICLILCFRKRGGWLTVLCLSLIGMMLVSFFTPATGEFGRNGSLGMKHQFKVEGKYVDVDEYVRNSGPEAVKRRYQDMTYRAIYWMHNPDNPYRTSPWLWHPDCLWWSPLMAFFLVPVVFFMGIRRTHQNKY
jgi:hypothetical protein